MFAQRVSAYHAALKFFRGRRNKWSEPVKNFFRHESNL